MKIFNKVIGVICVCVFMLSLSACGMSETSKSSSTQTEKLDVTTETITNKNSEEKLSDDKKQTRVLVAYFSATGNTKPLAEYTADILEADLYEIVPENPYTDDDLNYNNNDCRANKEQNDDACRPSISNKLEAMEQYDTVFVAFPIWWGKEPKIIDTFMESCNLSGKTMIPFCTSGGSGIAEAESNLHAMTDASVNWISGKRFEAGTSKEEISDWINQLKGSGKLSH